MKKISRVMREEGQHKQKVAFGLTRQLSNNLNGQYSENSREAGEIHRSHVQVDNLVSVTSGRPNTIITMTVTP